MNENKSRFSNPVEVSIRDIHQAFAEGELTAVRLVQMYLDRIAAYDQQGPKLNSIITINDRALQEAAALDKTYSQKGLTGPLHGIPIIVKDNMNTSDMPTSGGCDALRDSIPPDDAFVIKKLKRAGGIILAKSSMSEFAFGTGDTINSVLRGYTCNPYNPEYAVGGSSGGTGASISANFAVVGLGTDTACSVRTPSSINCLAGLRPTFGLVSCSGVIPMRVCWDTVGPMTRNMEDLAIVLDVMAGYDPDDTNTSECRGNIPESYTQDLTKNALNGMRIGVMRQVFQPEDADSEVIALTDQAMADMQKAGATIIDPLEIPGYRSSEPAGCFTNRFRYNLNSYLASLGPDAPFKTLGEIVDSERVLPRFLKMFRNLNENLATPEDDPEIALKQEITERVISWLGGVMDDCNLDAIALPTFSYPPRKNEGDDSPLGCNTDFASIAGFPALIVPMGFTSKGLPMGLQLVGKPWSESTLIRAG
ncbi:MAG TPA: amidase, partial [Phycisphaerae bacterium]|nr:amidase [Phycisphaerae bacterium]